MKEIFSERTRKKIRKGIGNYVKSSIFNKNPFPIWAYIFVTRKCNLSCDYCYITEEKFKEMGIGGASNDMDIDELKKAVDKLWGLGNRYVSFFGGEPTIRRRDLVEIVRYSSFEKQMFTQLPTNGTLLKREGYVNELGEAGIDLMDVSLDSLGRFDQSRKDSYHRESLFTRLLEGRRKHGFAIKTNYVITKKNTDQLERILEFGKENGFIVSIRLAMKPPIIPLNWKEENGLYFSTSPEDVEEVDRIADRVIQRKKQGYVVGEPIKFYEAMKRLVRGEKDFWQCEAGKHHITISNDGMVIQCEMLTDNFGIHFSELTPQYAQNLREQVNKNLARCNDNCLAAAYFCGQYYRRHPLSLIKEGFVKLN